MRIAFSAAYCPHCKTLLQVVLIQAEDGRGGYGRWCSICNLDPYPAYDPADPLEDE